MTIKIIFERSSKKEGSAGGFKRVDRGPILKFYCRAKAQDKNSILENRIFIVVSFSQQMQ